MLVIFKLSTHVNEKPTVKISEIGDPRVKRACFIMVDNWRDSNIVDCHVNDESFQDIVKFIEIWNIRINIWLDACSKGFLLGCVIVMS